MTGKTTWLIIIIVVIVAIILAIVLKPNIGSEPQITESQELIGGQTDDHGCLTAAGYAWCAERKACQRAWEDNCGPTSLDQAFVVLQAIRQLVMDNQFTAGYPANGELLWLSPVDKKTQETPSTTLTAKTLTLEPANMTAVELITKYLTEEGFQLDDYNEIDSSQGGSSGYTKDAVACVVSFVSDNIPLYNISVKCAPLPIIAE